MAVMTAASTAALAAITELRAGTAANVERISPVRYSISDPKVPAASIMMKPAFVVKASSSGSPVGDEVRRGRVLLVPVVVVVAGRAHVEGDDGQAAEQQAPRGRAQRP
jgi:hypothetical protein